MVFSFFREVYTPYYEIKMKGDFQMKNFSSVVLVALIGCMAGMLIDSYYMANDEEFHDYWMKKSKKTE